MENILLFLNLIFIIFFLLLWGYSKYVAIASVFSIKYSNKIDYLKTKKIYYPLWLYMDINQTVFRLILKGQWKKWLLRLRL